MNFRHAVVGLTIAFWFFASSIFGQQIVKPTPKPGSWMRVVSDNGEFSLEIPENYHHVWNKDGFFVSYGRGYDPKELQEPHFVRSMIDGTVFWLEVYKAKKDALKAVYDTEQDGVSPSKLKQDGYEKYQVVTKTDEYYSIRQYFASKTAIYVLVAASRDDKNPAIDRFISSVKFTPDAKLPSDPVAKPLSSLAVSPVNIKLDNVEPYLEKKEDEKPVVKNENIKSMLIVTKPKPSYPPTAFNKRSIGEVCLRVTFAADGFVPDIEVVKSLPEGILRETIFAALRFKYLPKEDHGKPVTLTRIVSYEFNIY